MIFDQSDIGVQYRLIFYDQWNLRMETCTSLQKTIVIFISFLRCFYNCMITCRYTGSYNPLWLHDYLLLYHQDCV